MKITIKNSSMSFLARQIDPTLVAELKSAYGNNISQKKINACANFLSAIGYGQSNSIYSKLGLLMIPVLADLSDDVVVTSAFYDFVNKEEATVGGKSAIGGVYKTVYLSVNGEYKYSENYNFSTNGICCKADETNTGYPWNLLNYSDNSISVKTFSPFCIMNTEDGSSSTTLFTGGGTNKLGGALYKGSNPYINFNTSTAYKNERYDHPLVMSGTGTSGEIVILDGSELTYTGDVTIDENLKMSACGFGASSPNTKYSNGCRGDIKYKMMGYAVGLSVSESRTLSAAMEAFILAMA